MTIHRLFHASTIEDVMNDRLQHKRDVADTAVVGVRSRREPQRPDAGIECQSIGGCRLITDSRLHGSPASRVE